MPDFTVLANAIRALSMDAVQAANSGHPGMPMGMADIATVLWREYLAHNPDNPGWENRDRFVLSNGHGSMLAYALLHLSGYDLTLDDLKQFRQLGSRTPGHPEVGDTPGIETTTGPLGQGLANAVGMALAEHLLARRFNRPDIPIIDHYTYVFCGDGCLMEGISHECCSLAGRLGLGKLVLFYDDNGISIDGEVDGWFRDDTAQRFAAYGWQVQDGVDGHDDASIRKAIDAARAATDKPSLICCKTVIGKGAPGKQGSAAAHGAPLGDTEIQAARAELGWNHPPFVIPDEVYAAWNATAAGREREHRWQSLLQAYVSQYPSEAEELQRRWAGELPADFNAIAQAAIAKTQADGVAMATRKASQMALEALAPSLPELIGGSADLAGSNNTIWSGSVDVNEDTAESNYVYFGVREFAMTAIANGLALHGGFIPYGATFLVFSDYARNALRMSALMGIGAIQVYTHDSIGLGEDGPTHQPVEHLASLRLIPELDLWRPCDAVESLVAWQQALLRRDGPTALVFTRQSLPQQARNAAQMTAIERGGYVLLDCEDHSPEAIFVATGSEVELAVQAAKQLGSKGVAVRVVSMPCVARFDAQPSAYRDAVLPPQVTARVCIEAGVTEGWHRFAGPAGRVIGLDRFGASAPAEDLFKTLGFTPENVVAAMQSCLDAKAAAG